MKLNTRHAEISRVTVYQYTTVRRLFIGIFFNEYERFGSHALCNGVLALARGRYPWSTEYHAASTWLTESQSHA